MRDMTTREKAQKLLDELPESELEPIVEILASRTEDSSARNVVPKALRLFDSGREQPNWAKLIRRSRLEH
jgi:hypothetical protein